MLRKILIIILIILCLVLFLQNFDVESFSSTNVNTFTPVKVYVNYLTSNDTLASGVVFKSSQAGTFEYIIEALLPVVIGGDHTNSNGSYIVYLGKDQSSLKEAGVLLRYPDHMYRLQVYTPENYMFTRISLRKDSSETIVFDKQLL